MKRKAIVFTLIGCCLFLCIVSLVFRGKNEQYNQEQTAIEQTPFFFPEDQSSVTFDLKASFVVADKDFPTETEVVVSKIAEGKKGNLYSVKINLDIGYTEWFSDEWDRYELGYFYVTADKIYLIRDKEMAERFKEEELKEKGTVLCQETEKKDPIEGEKGWHEYITIQGDICEFHSYNDLVETGFYEAFIWEKEKGLVKYWSGYGAERDAITLERSRVSILDKDTQSDISENSLEEVVQGLSESTTEQEPEVKAEPAIYREGSMPSLKRQQEFLGQESLLTHVEHYIKHGENLYGITYDNEAVLVRSYEDHSKGADYGKIIIPNEVEGYPVTGIAEGAIVGLNVTELALPDTLRVMEDDAVHLDFQLGVVNIPKGMKTIGNTAFAWPVIPSYWHRIQADATENRMVIKNGYLLYCDSQEEILMVPDGVRVISEDVFASSMATEIVLPESVEEIYSIPHKLRKMNIPDSVIRMELDTDEEKSPWFQEKIKKANNGFVIVNGILLYCGLEAEEVTIPEGVWSIYGAFSGNKNLKKITVPEGVTEIGYGAFAGCSNLKDIALPESLIEMGGFGGCGIENIILPKGLKKIGESTFSGCDAMREVVLPEGIKEVAKGTFYDCDMLEKVTLPDSVTALGAFAFSNCENLREIVMPECLRYIGRGAFEDCYALTEIRIPDSVEFIDWGACWNCLAVRYLSLGENVVFIDGSLLYTYPADYFDATLLEAATTEETVIELPEEMPVFLEETAEWEVDGQGRFFTMFGLRHRKNVIFVVHRGSPAEEVIKKYQFKDGEEMYRYCSYEEYAAAQYEAFLRNEISATDSGGKKYRISDLVGEYDNAKYIYRDIDGDGKKELHIDSHLYYVMKYENHTLNVFYEGSGYEWPVNNGELCGILYARPGGAPTHTSYRFITFSPEGEAVEGAMYLWGDANENFVADDEDWYLKDNVEISQEEWNGETKAYQRIDDKLSDEWIHEWIPVVVMW